MTLKGVIGSCGMSRRKLPIKVRRGLEKLKAKERLDPIDFHDLVIDSMGRTIAKLGALSELSGEKITDVKVVLSFGEVVIDQSDAYMPWRERLFQIRDMAQSIASSGLAEESVEELYVTLTKADGWKTTGNRLKTPAWLNDYTEMTLKTAAGLEGLEWVRHLG